MPWGEKRLESWNQFSQLTSNLTVGAPSTVAYIFRGHADANWSLKPSLLRHLNPNVSVEAAIRIEDDALREFRSQAHRHVSHSLLGPKSKLLQWWSLMQHHHAPTRLLDWTTSPFVAAYFSAEGHWECDGAIWLVHARDLCAPLINKLGHKFTLDEGVLRNPQSEPFVQPWFPNYLSDRMAAQQGMFTVCHNVLGNQEDIIDKTCQGEQARRTEEVYRKVIVPKELKMDFIRKLRTMNITANSLFPGVDGLGRSVTELTRLASFFPREPTNQKDKI